MPPKKKSKKVVSNRGFATTSVPRKKTEEEEAAAAAAAAELAFQETSDPSPTSAAAASSPPEGSGVNGSTTAEATTPGKDGEWDAEASERSELQALAEKVRPAAEKEISRAVKAIDYERRMSKTLPSYAWIEQNLQHRILEAAKAAKDAEPQHSSQDGEDELIVKIASLYGVLEQLGFSSLRIEECLRVIKHLALEEALDWLFLNCDTEELGCDGPVTVAPDHPHSTPATPQIERNDGFVHSGTATPAVAPVENGSHEKFASNDSAGVEAALRARILAYDNELDREIAALEDSDANAVYAGLKVQLSEVQRAQGAAKRAAKGKGKAPVSLNEEDYREKQIELLKKKLALIENDYTFRKVDAEKLYREERTKLDATQLAERLNSTKIDAQNEDNAPSIGRLSDDHDAPPPTVGHDSPKSSSAAVSASTGGNEPSANGDKNTDSSEDEGGAETLFGTMLDEMPSTDTNDQGATIQVRDMALPKHFSGKTPKINLEETVRKQDRFATVLFKVISSSRAVRASVTIRWDGGRTQQWDMQEIACYDQKQAYNYIATVALFSISTTAVHKQLPSIFRDLWDELVRQKEEEDQEAYRQQLKVYKTIVEARSQLPPSRDQRVTKSQTTASSTESLKHRSTVSPEESQRIKDTLTDRQSWPSYQEMLEQRSSLPIAAYRSFITSTIEQNQCVVLCGETGCGKSTQVPSFILEHDMRKGRNVKIFCTEPRRISAISLAQRVSAELGESPNACGTRNSLVGYSIRLDSAVSASNRIVYATTGIVLRMLEGRDSLSDCTHIIIDEVHERSIDSDFLLIVLRQLLEHRRDLKVILMSATVDAEKIAAYMGDCPVITVPGRTFPVTAHYLEEIVEMTRYRLEPTTDSPYVSRRMRQYGGRSAKTLANDDIPLDDDDDIDAPGIAPLARQNLSKQTQQTLDCLDHHAINFDLIIMLLENLCFYNAELVPYSSAILIFLPSLETIRRLTDLLESHPSFGSSDFLALPLHSTISNEKQSLVFDVPQVGVRKIVISTNIAETGVTIPDITAVIDTGKHREMRFDEKRQISRLTETFVAQSNAAQRRGRAGRVQEGVAFHLFTKHRHDTMMAEHPEPEMLRLSLQDLALRIKIMKIGTSSIENVLLQALDPPLQVNIQRAVSSLVEAKALTAAEEITDLGRHLARLPMDVHLGKFLIMACIFNCLDAALTITAVLNAKSPWLTPFGREAEADAVKRGFKIENSDFLTTYNAYTVWREASGNGFEREFCRKSFLSQQNLQMIEELRQQYFSFLIDAGFIQCTEAQKRELISTRYGKSRTRFVRVPEELDTHSRDAKAVMACLAASLYPKLLIVDPASGQMRTLSNNAPAAIHPSSVNFAPGRRIDFGGAKYIAFFTAMRTKKLYVWESGAVDERAVYLLCGNADFQLPAHSFSIDRKLKVHVEPKTAMVIKVLRQRWNSFFLAKMANPTLELDGEQKLWLELIKEALVSPPKAEDDVAKKKKTDRPAVKVSLTRHAE